MEVLEVLEQRIRVCILPVACASYDHGVTCYGYDVRSNRNGIFSNGQAFQAAVKRMVSQKACIKQTVDSGQQIADSRQVVADSRQQTPGSRQQATDSGQQAADSRQQTADSGQQTADKW
jgi:hypothetical protein